MSEKTTPCLVRPRDGGDRERHYVRLRLTPTRNGDGPQSDPFLAQSDAGKPEGYQRTSRTSRPAGAHRGHQHLRCLRQAIRPARPRLTPQDSTQRSTTAGEQVITTDTQVLLRRDGLDVVALPQTWGRLPPYLRGPRRTATEPDVFEKEEHSHDRRPRRPDRRRARPPRSGVPRGSQPARPGSS